MIRRLMRSRRNRLGVIATFCVTLGLIGWMIDALNSLASYLDTIAVKHRRGAEIRREVWTG